MNECGSPPQALDDDGKDELLSTLGSEDAGDELPLTLDGAHVVNSYKAAGSAANSPRPDTTQNAASKKEEEEKKTMDSIGLFFGVQPDDRMVPRAAYDSLLTRLNQVEANLAAATRELRLEQDRGRESQDKCSELSQALKLAGDTLKVEVDQQRELQRKLQQREDELVIRERTVEILEQRLRSCGQPGKIDFPPMTVGSFASVTRPSRSPVPTLNVGGHATAHIHTPALAGLASQPARLPRLSHPHAHAAHPAGSHQGLRLEHNLPFPDRVGLGANTGASSSSLGQHTSHTHTSPSPLPPELTARGGGRLTSLGFV